MKKFLKSFLVIMVAVCVALPLVACKKKVSPTTADLTNVKAVNGISTNGGITAIYGEYLYFINGTKTNDGTSSTKNTRSAICRVKYNETTGETTGDIEVVVDDLVGFTYGSLYFFGDYMYYATPCSDKNSSATVLYNKTTFKRYDLVNKKSYTLYTTAKNDSSESISYAYYISGETLNLLVYESKAELNGETGTIKSLKIDKKVTENYTISGATSCLFSENYGNVTLTGASVDANSFVYYTKDPIQYEEAIQTGDKVYKTSPVTNNSTCIYNGGEDIELKTIRAGKLVYAVNEVMYAQSITNKSDEKLVIDIQHAICHGAPEHAIYLENYKLVGEGETTKLEKAEGDIVVLSFAEDEKQFSISQWGTSSYSHDIDFEGLTTIEGDIKDFELIGTAILEETIEDDESEEGADEVKEKYLYVTYKNSSTLYKLKIAKINDDGSMNLDLYNSCIKLSGSTLSETTGLLLPEVIGNYMFILAQDDDKNNYLIKVDLTAKETVTSKSDFFNLEEVSEQSESDEDDE